jgi:hypothetical protein
MIFCNKLIFYGEELLAQHPTQASGPPLVDCPQLLIQYIRSYPPYQEAVSSICNLRKHQEVVTRDQPNMGNNFIIDINTNLTVVMESLAFQLVDVVAFTLTAFHIVSLSCNVKRNSPGTESISVHDHWYIERQSSSHVFCNFFHEGT